MCNQESRLLKTSKQRFFEAVEADDGNAIRALIDAWADPQQFGENGLTPAYIAAYKGKINALKAFLEYERPGCEFNNVNQRVVCFADPRYHGRTLLYGAARGNQPGVVTYLLSRSADTSLTNGLGETPAVIATMEGHFDVLKILIETGGVKADETRRDVTRDSFFVQVHPSQPDHAKRLLPDSSTWRQMGLHVQAVFSFQRTDANEQRTYISEHFRALLSSGLWARARSEIRYGSVFQHHLPGEVSIAVASISLALLYEPYLISPSLLCLAVAAGDTHTQIVDYLLRQGATTGLEPDYTQAQGPDPDWAEGGCYRKLPAHTPIMIAVRQGDIAMCQQLGLTADNINTLHLGYLPARDGSGIRPSAKEKVCCLSLLAFDAGKTEWVEWALVACGMDLQKVMSFAFMRFHKSGYPVPESLLARLTVSNFLSITPVLAMRLVALTAAEESLNVPCDPYITREAFLDEAQQDDERKIARHRRAQASFLSGFFSEEHGLKARLDAHLREMGVPVLSPQEVTVAGREKHLQELLERVVPLASQDPEKQKRFLDMLLCVHHNILLTPVVQAQLRACLSVPENKHSCLYYFVCAFIARPVISKSPYIFFHFCSVMKHYQESDFQKWVAFGRELFVTDDTDTFFFNYDRVSAPAMLLLLTKELEITVEQLLPLLSLVVTRHNVDAPHELAENNPPWAQGFQQLSLLALARWLELDQRVIDFFIDCGADPNFQVAEGVSIDDFLRTVEPGTVFLPQRDLEASPTFEESV